MLGIVCKCQMWGCVLCVNEHGGFDCECVGVGVGVRVCVVSVIVKRPRLPPCVIDGRYIETPFIIISIALPLNVPVFFWGSWFGFPSSCLTVGQCWSRCRR